MNSAHQLSEKSLTDLIGDLPHAHGEITIKLKCHFNYVIVGYGRGGVAESFIYDSSNMVVNEDGTTAPPLPTQPLATPQATN